MKKLSLLIALITILGCSQREKVIEIKLQDIEGFGVFRKSQIILWPNRLELPSYTGVPDNIVEYVIRTISMQPGQDVFDLYHYGHTSEEQYKSYFTSLGIDTMMVTDKIYNHRVLILIGTDENGTRIIIPDSTGDLDFSNDEMFEYEYPLEIEKQLEAEKTLPSINVSVQLFIQNGFVDRTVKLVLSPYETYRRLTYNTEIEAEHKYHLFASIPVHKQGLFNIKDESYSVYISNQFTSALFHEGNTQIFITPDTILPSQRDGDIPSSIGDITNLDGYDYLIESVSPLGESVVLQYLGENKNPAGITEGYSIPRFNAVTLDQNVFSLEDFPEKYVLLDFWGTWCNPCIQLIPELKALNSEFQNTNFQLIGVAFDRDIDKVSDFVEKNGMDWVHLFVDQNRIDKGSLVEVFKVTSYPTKILIDPNGKILARGKSIEEIRAILNEKITAL